MVSTQRYLNFWDGTLFQVLLRINRRARVRIPSRYRGKDRRVMKDVPRYLHWWLIQISVPNLVVIGLMVLVFVLALVVPFPHRRSRGGAR